MNDDLVLLERARKGDEASLEKLIYLSQQLAVLFVVIF